MKQVTKDCFYDSVGNLDVVVDVTNTTTSCDTAEFKLRNSGKLKGKVIDRISMEQNEEYIIKEYFLSEA